MHSRAFDHVGASLHHQRTKRIWQWQGGVSPFIFDLVVADSPLPLDQRFCRFAVQCYESKLFVPRDRINVIVSRDADYIWRDCWAGEFVVLDNAKVRQVLLHSCGGHERKPSVGTLWRIVIGKIAKEY